MAGEPTTIKDGPDLRSKKNGTGSDLARGTVVKLHTTEDEVALPGATTDPILGVTAEIIKNGQFGAVQIRGKALARAQGALATIGIRLMPVAATGRVQAHADGNSLVGGLETTAAAQDDLVEVELAGPFAHR